MNGVDPNDLVSPCRTEGLFLTILVFEPQPNTILMSIFATSDSKNMLPQVLHLCSQPLELFALCPPGRTHLQGAL